MHFNLIRIFGILFPNHIDEQNEEAEKKNNFEELKTVSILQPPCEFRNDKIGSLARLFASYTSTSIYIHSYVCL